jgi:MscS family membrane protein
MTPIIEKLIPGPSRVFVPVSLLFLVLTLSTPAASAQDEDATVDPNPLRPADTSSPRSTLEGFLESVNRAYRVTHEADAALEATQPKMTREEAREMERTAGNLLRHAVHTLDLSQIPRVLREDVGIESALRLKEIFDRMELPPIETVPDAQMVAAEQAGRPSSRMDEPVRWRFPDTEIEIVEIMDGERQGQFLFSSGTVARIGDYYNRIKDFPYRMVDNFEYVSPEKSEGFYEHYISTPGYLVPNAHFLGRLVDELPARLNTTWGKQTLWQWVGFLLSMLIAALASYVVYRVLIQSARRLSAPLNSWLMILAPISIAFIVGVVVKFVSNDLNITGDLYRVVVRGGRVTVIAMTTWAVFLLSKTVGSTIIALPGMREHSSEIILVRIGSIIVGVLLGLVAIIKGLQSLGADLVPLLAGLGIGGLAVALAAQRTLANFIGSLILLINKPVEVGDFCRYGDQIGTVERIGMISTGIRSLERTIITVPNATFSEMELDNFSKRDQRLLKTVLQLRYETTPEQMRYVLAKLRELLLGHPKVTPQPTRVRFVGYGAYSKNLEIFAYLDCQDQNTFLAMKEDILLRIEDIVNEAGSGFAFPSQTAYLSRDEGLDAGKRGEAEDRVRQWRNSSRLPFPEFEAREREQLENVLDYPPKGSPDYEPTEVSPDEQPATGSAALTPDDLVDLPSLVIRLQEGSDLARYLRGRLSEETLDLLSRYGGGRDDKLKEALVGDLNAIILGPSIYDEQRFSRVELRQETLDLLSTNPQRTNRLLLDDAFPPTMSTH